MLAIDGGSPVRTTPWAPWPQFDADEIEAATAVLRSGKVNYWTGDVGREFERRFAARIGVEHAVAVSNGTVALELALRGVGVGPGDEVVVPSCTFVATASAVAALGARPVFADVCERQGSMTADTLQAAATPRTKAAIVVHLGGWPAPIQPIAELCRSNGYKLIEDCAQAHGAAVAGRSVGTFGDVAAFSFCQDKIMTTGGEGGMVVTPEGAVWSKVWSAKDHGKSWEAVYEHEHPPGFRWLHTSLGTNARLTEFQSAIGLQQLRKLDDWVAARRAHAHRLLDGLDRHPAVWAPRPNDTEYGSYYRVYARIRPEALAPGWTRDRVMVALEAEGIPCRVGSCAEIYRETAFPRAWKPDAPLPRAARLSRTALAFTVHPTLSASDIDDTLKAVDKVMAVAQR